MWSLMVFKKPSIEIGLVIIYGDIILSLYVRIATLLENQPELYNSQIPDSDEFRTQLNETQPGIPMHKLAHRLYPPTASYAV